MTTFKNHVSAAEYMEVENPRFVAWSEGPITGEYRVRYVEAHKAYLEALKNRNDAEIADAWKSLRSSAKNWVDHCHTGSNPENIQL